MLPWEAVSSSSSSSSKVQGVLCRVLWLAGVVCRRAQLKKFNHDYTSFFKGRTLGSAGKFLILARGGNHSMHSMGVGAACTA